MNAVRHEIRAEIVGNVLEIVAKEGTVVAAGDTLVLLESMKMEIPVLTEVAGRTVSVAVSTGAIVQSGDIIGIVETEISTP